MLDLLGLRPRGHLADRYGRHGGTSTKATIDSSQPLRRVSTQAGLVGLPTIRTRIEMPSTPPSCRALETRADAVA